jgi:hypothetical protein
MTCIRLLASKRRIQLKEMLYTKELTPRMRSRPRQSSRNSINTGGQYSFWPTLSDLQKHTCVHCSWPVCAQIWRRVVVAVAATSRFWFWLGLSLGYGLESLIKLLLFFLGTAILGERCTTFFWLSSLGFASGIYLCQG